MYRLLCLCLAVGIASALLKTTTVTFDVDETAKIPCDGAPWIDMAFFYQADSAYGNPDCDYYINLDLRTAVAMYCEKEEGACSFDLSDVLGKDPDTECVSRFGVGYAC